MATLMRNSEVVVVFCVCIVVIFVVFAFDVAVATAVAVVDMKYGSVHSIDGRLLQFLRNVAGRELTFKIIMQFQFGFD
jgi:hypothetical protein